MVVSSVFLVAEADKFKITMLATLARAAQTNIGLQYWPPGRCSTLFLKHSLKKKEKRETISNCIIIITGNRWYSWDHMQSTLAGGLQYLSPLSIVSTLNEQRKRSNLNESLELNFRINFSRRTSMFFLILLTFDFRFDNRHTYINVLSIRHDSLFFQVSVWVLDPTVKFLYCLWRYSTDKSLSSR